MDYAGSHNSHSLNTSNNTFRLFEMHSVVLDVEHVNGQTASAHGLILLCTYEERSQIHEPYMAPTGLKPVFSAFRLARYLVP